MDRIRLQYEHEINVRKPPFEWLLILKRVNIEPEVLQSDARAVKSPDRGFDLTNYFASSSSNRKG